MPTARLAPFAIASLLASIAIAIAACDDGSEVAPTDDAGATDGGSSGAIDTGSGPMKGCQLPHDCRGMRDPSTCAPLALPSFADGGRLVLNVDACKVTSPGGGMPEPFDDETGRHRVSATPGGSFCSSSLLDNAPALETKTPGSGFVLTDVTGDFVFGTSSFAILAVAIYQGSARSNQVIFTAQEESWPFRGPALVANFAWAERDADGGNPFPATTTPTNYVAAQLWWGSEPVTGGPSPGFVNVSLLPYDCKPHLFRLGRNGTKLSLFVDGRLEAEQTRAEDGGAVDLRGPVVARIGNSGAEATRNLDGAIGQVIVVREADEVDIVALETDLKRRWKIP